MSHHNTFILIAAINGFLAVGFGAFGSHGLKERLSEHMLNVWQTAVQYQFYHVMALLFIGLLQHNGLKSQWLNVSGWGFTAGITLFSGSLYWMALGGPKWLGPITPLGGLCFLTAWLCLAVAAFK